MDAICRMNRMDSREVPSAKLPEVRSHRPHGISDEWIYENLMRVGAPGEVWRAFELLNRMTPSNVPEPAFTNGDLSPANFIFCGDGTVGIIDWEFAGFTDPLAEIILLRWWPPDRPFLSRFLIDELYCSCCGYDTALLPWYRLNGAIYGWLQATLNAGADIQAARNAEIRECVAGLEGYRV
jgi:aminoglycoside phosphotransferase (APT) family kinase protein